MKKKKHVRMTRTREELAEYFSDRRFDPERQCINKIMREHPEETDASVIEAAAEEMLSAARTGVLLSPDDALRLAVYTEPASVETLAKELNEAGITDDNIFDIIAGARIGDEDDSPAIQSPHALFAANLLQRYAGMLTGNKDTLLLRLPEYSRESDRACVMLAFLGEDLSLIEQRILEQMKSVADSVAVSREHGVTRIWFFIENVWEKG